MNDLTQDTVKDIDGLLQKPKEGQAVVEVKHTRWGQ